MTSTNIDASIMESLACDEENRKVLMAPLDEKTMSLWNDVNENHSVSPTATALVTPTASTLSNNYTAMLITPTSSQPSPSKTIVTPNSPSDTQESSNNRKRDRDGYEDGEVGREDARHTAEALDNLLQGIQCVKRILEDPMDQAQIDQTTSACNKDFACRISTDIGYISSLSNKLVGILGSHLIGLLNAAEMARSHAQLYAEENSLLLAELYDAKNKCIKAYADSEQTQIVNRRLYKEKRRLLKHNHKLQTERKTLIQEVKSLRKQADETQRFDTWRLLEEHVLDSVAIHELILKSSYIGKKTQIDNDENVSKMCPSLKDTDVFKNENMAAESATSQRKIEKVAANDGSSSHALDINQTDEEKNDVVSKKRGFGFLGRFALSSPENDTSAFENIQQGLEHSQPQPLQEKSVQLDEENEKKTLEDRAEADSSCKVNESNNKVNDSNDDIVLNGFSKDEQSLRQRKRGKRTAFGRFWSRQSRTDHDNDSKTGNCQSSGENKNTDTEDKVTEDEDCAEKIVEESFVFDRTYRVVSSTVQEVKEGHNVGDENQTKCTESSRTDTLESEANESDGKGMPTDVSFQIRGIRPESNYSTPCVSPQISPDVTTVTHLKPISDPHILRTLAIPQSEHPL